MLNIEDSIQEGELFDGHYKLIRPLSTDGATADVWLALDINTIDTEIDEDEDPDQGKSEESGMLVAIKIYRPKNALDIEGEQRFRDEFKIVYECRHENLLQPTAFSIYKDIPYLVLPYCQRGSSEQLIGKKQTPEEIWKFIDDVSSGLAKLHSNHPQIIHQDIKPANILIDNSSTFTITDFGISAKTNGLHGHYYNDDNSGTMAYMAPERFNHDPTPLPESDIWAFGATLYEILTRKVPFGEEGGNNQNSDTPMPPLTNVPHSVRNLVYACLQHDPKKRPTAKQIQQAAQTRQYPPKRKTWLFITTGLLTCLAVFLAVFLTRKTITPPQPMLQETFAIALRQLNTNNADTLKVGLQAMDSLSNLNYIPAMYEMAFTYGWYSDSLSVQRKRLLGIKTTQKKFPISDEYNVKAKALLTYILDMNDSTYADINANAAFRLACYYGEVDGSVDSNNKVNYEEALRFIDIADHWANITQNPDLERKITNGRKVLERNSNKE